MTELLDSVEVAQSRVTTRRYRGTELMATEKAPLLDKIKAADLSKTAIFLGAGVDPDGLAAQAVMAHLVNNWGGKALCFYRGTFNRPQNRTMKELLGLSPKPEEDFKVADGYTCVISVDGPSGVCPTVPDFIIDHHSQHQAAKLGNDVRLIGATSSIMWEYATAAGVDFSTEEGSKLATALAIGIITDTRTGAEESCTDLDYDALSFCLKHKDTRLFRGILNFPKPAYYNELFVTGWNNKTVEGTVLVTGLGPLTVQRSGVISDLAEKYAEMDGISTAIVFAVVDGNIDISVRSSNPSLNVEDFVQSAFGEGGGKRGAGRAVVDLPILFKNLPDHMNESIFKIAREIIVHKALQTTGDGARAQQ